MANVLTVTYWATLVAMARMMALSARSTRLAEGAVSQELADLGDQRGELRGELDVLGDPLGVVGDDLLGGLRLGDGVVALDELLQGDDVHALVVELLRGRVALLLREARAA